MATANRAEYLAALLNQKKQNQVQGGNVVNQGNASQAEQYQTNPATQSESSSKSDPYSWGALDDVFGGIDELAAQFGSGWVSAFEGVLDFGANALGALGDATGWYDSKPFTDWAKQDLGQEAANYVKTYANFTPWAIIKNIQNGNYANGDYWSNAGKGLLDVMSLGNYQRDETYSDDVGEYYGFDDGSALNGNAVGQFASGMAHAFGSMLPSIMMGNIAGAAGATEKAAKAARMAFTGISGAGKASESALNDGASAGQAFLYGTASGAINTATEYIPWEKIPGLGKVLGENTLPGMGMAKLSVKEIARTMMQEGLEDAIGDMANPLIKMIYKGSGSLEEYSSPEFWVGVGKSFLQSALTAGVIGTVNGIKAKNTFSNEGIDAINKTTQWAQDYNDLAERFNSADKLFSTGRMTHDEYSDSCDAIAKEIKALSAKGQEIGELWDAVPKDKMANCEKFYVNPQLFAAEMNETAEGIDANSPKYTVNAPSAGETPEAMNVQYAANAARGQSFDMAKAQDISQDTQGKSVQNSAEFKENYDGKTTIENDPKLPEADKAKYQETKQKAETIMSRLESDPLPYEPDESKPRQYVFVAPLYKSDAQGGTDFSTTLSDFSKNCERIAKLSGCGFASADNADGLYKNAADDFVQEPSLSIDLGNISQENADLASSLMADLGYQQQESSIVYNLVRPEDFNSLPPSNKAFLFQIKFGNGTDVDAIKKYFRENKIPATVTNKEIMFLKSYQYDFDGNPENAKAFALEIKKYCDTLKADGKLEKDSTITKFPVNERYNDRDVRSDLYGKNGIQDGDSGAIRSRDDGDVQPSQDQESPASEINADDGDDNKNGSFNSKAKVPLSARQAETEEKPLTEADRKRAYEKARANFETPEQTKKDAAPSQTVSLSSAKDYAKKEADLVTSYINYRTGESSDFFVEGSNEKLGRKYTAAVDMNDKKGAVAALDEIFEDNLKNGYIKTKGEKGKISVYSILDSDELSDVKDYAHSIHQAMVDGAEQSKISKMVEAFQGKLDRITTKYRNTVEMVKAVDRFNKNADITKRQFNIDQSKFPDEYKTDGTIRAIAGTLPKYNILMKDGQRYSDNSGLGLSSKNYVKWATDSKKVMEGLIKEDRLVNYDQAKSQELLDAFDTVMGGDPNSKRLSVDQVNAMTKIVKMLRFQISDQANKQREAIRNNATAINNEVSYKMEADGLPKAGSFMEKVNTFTKEQVKMMVMGDAIMGYDGSGLQKAMDSLTECIWKFYDDYYGMRERYSDTAEMKAYSKAAKGNIEIDGKKISRAEALDAYLMFTDQETRGLMDDAKRTDSRRIRFSNGVTLDYDRGTYKLLEDALGEDFSSKGKKLILEGFYNDHSKGSYIEKARNYQLETTGDSSIPENSTDHYPRGMTKESALRVNSTNSLEGSTGSNTLGNSNVTKSRKASQAIVELEAKDPFQRMDDYMSQLSNEMNLRYQSNEFLRMFGMNVKGTDGKTTRLQMTLGDQYTNYMRDFVKMVNGMELVKSDGSIGFIQGGAVTATLGISPINPTKNFLSLFKEGHEVGFGNVMKVVANPSKWFNSDLGKAIRETGVWKARYDDGVFESLANTSAVSDAMRKAGKASTYLYGKFDQMTSMAVAQVDYEYVKKAYPSLSKQEQIEMAKQIWMRDVNLTQSTGEQIGKSQSQSGRIMGKDSQIVKASYTFQSDTVAGASMLFSDATKLLSSTKTIKWAKNVLANEATNPAEKVSMAKEMLAKATKTRNAIIKSRLPAGIAATLVGATLKYLIENLNSRVKGKKEWTEPVFTADSLKEIAENTVSSVTPFTETILSAIKYNDGQSSLFAFSQLTDLLKGVSTLMKGNTRTGLIDIGKSVAKFYGIPVDNIYDYTVGFASGFDPKIAAEAKNFLYHDEKSQTSYKNNFSMALYERVGDVSDDVRIELRTLSDSGLDMKPSGVATSYKNEKGDDVTISWSSKQEMRKYYQKANAKLAKALKSDSYRSLSDEEKAKVIKRLYSSYKEASLAKVVTKKAPTSAAAALAYANYGDIGTLLSAVAHISDLEGTKTMSKKQRAIAYVNSLKGLSKAQRMTILQMAGYTVDSKYLGQLLRESGMDNKTIKEMTSA